MKKAVLQRIVDYLLILKQLYEDEAVPPMVDESDPVERIAVIEDLLRTLGYREEKDEEDKQA